MNSKFVSIIVIFVLISIICFPIVSSNSLVINKIKTVDNTQDYIIKFKEEPLSVFKNRLKNVFSIKIEQKINEYRQNLLKIHNEVKNRIKDILKISDDNVFKSEYTTVFNGISVKNVPENFIERIKQLPHVDDVEPDYKIVMYLSDSVPLINADKVWSLNDSFGRNITGKNIKIAIVDSGVDYNHPDLKDKYMGGYNYIDNNFDPMDDNGHGTHCAGIALGTGNVSNYSYVGLAPDAELYAYKIIDSDGDGDGSNFISALERAVSVDDVDIISLSLGTEQPGSPDDFLSVAADNAVAAGVVVVASAGNGGSAGDGTVTSPGCARRVITVGSSSKSDFIAGSSSRGPTVIGTVKPDLVAPGVGIVSTRAEGTDMYGDGTHIVNDYYYRSSGTSMACPHVSGAVALLLQKHPDWDPVEIKMALRNTAVDLDYGLNLQGFGRLDCLGLLQLDEAPPVAVLNTSGIVDDAVFAIRGTASGKDFVNYSLYVIDESGESLLYTNDSPVVDDVLYFIDTIDLGLKEFKIKLVVNSINSSSVDIVYISQYGLTIYEKELFSISLTDSEGDPIRAWFILDTPYHLPKIRYGSQVIFRAPTIFRDVDSLDGKLIVFKFLGGFEKQEYDVKIVNKN